ncbi:MAG: glutamate 5-kinase [Bdellovibrionia bacterium]
MGVGIQDQKKQSLKTQKLFHLPRQQATSRGIRLPRGEGRKIRRRWVIKSGSSLVCAGGPLLIRGWMKQVLGLRKKYGIEVIWVTSGAIASAVARTGFRKKNRKISEKQALSAIGQPLVMDLYNLALHAEGLMGAQVLLTYDDLVNPKRLGHFKTTLEQLLHWGAVPILNENDVVSNDEIQFGDNDSLSAKVAFHARAERLLILTDVHGLYDDDPKTHENAQLLHDLHEVSDELLGRMPQQAGSSSGTGGMFSKLRAAREASENGVETWLVKGDLPEVLGQVAEGLQVGTRVRAQFKKRNPAGLPRGWKKKEKLLVSSRPRKSVEVLP